MNENSKSMWSAVAIACLLFGVASIALGIPFFLKQHEILATWPKAKAYVHKSEVVEVTTGGDRLYATRFEMSFITGDQIQLVTVNAYRRGADRKVVQAAADRFPAGSWALVRYNPQNPSDVRLDTDHLRRFFQIPIALGITGLIFIITSGIVFLMIRL